MIRSLNVTALSIVVPTVLAVATANAQQQAPPKSRGSVTAFVVMTPSGPATCATWVQWRGPAAHSTDRAAIQYWAEGYISRLAAGSHNDVLGNFRLEDLGAWLDRYCASNSQTKLPEALNALGREMLAHPGGKL